jgi:iron complex transport system substrate-binding protein
MTRLAPWLLTLALGLTMASASADRPLRCAVDDHGQELCLERPARRIAALSPGATELLFAAGAGDAVVAVVAHSDYPPAATAIESIGSHARVDLERLLALAPDLVIGWISGNPSEQLAAIAALGLPLFLIEPRQLDAVASAIERLATLAGTETVGRAEASRFRGGMAALAERHAEADPVPVFYQVWDQPLMTVNDQHLIGQVLRICGGRNVFGQLDRLVPRLSLEAVLGADPEAIIVGGMGEENPAWLEPWRAYPGLTAVRRDNLFFIPPSLLQRPTPRLLEGAVLLCEKLEVARGRHDE